MSFRWLNILLCLFASTVLHKVTSDLRLWRDYISTNVIFHYIQIAFFFIVCIVVSPWFTWLKFKQNIHHNSKCIRIFPCMKLLLKSIFALLYFLRQTCINVFTGDLLKSKIECENPSLLGLLKLSKCQEFSSTLTVNAWPVASFLFPFIFENHKIPDNSGSLKCVYEAKNPLHKLWPCIRKSSGNSCIMWNNLTYASFSCERRQAVHFTLCPRWPVIESSQISRFPLCCMNNSISQGAWKAHCQLCSQVKIQIG